MEDCCAKMVDWVWDRFRQEGKKDEYYNAESGVLDLSLMRYLFLDRV